jgi:hypothetical protein
MKNNQSTGPRSVEGKAVSRFNALKTGIYAKAEVVLPAENPDDLENLTAEYYDRFAPGDPEQRCLVDALISDEWLLRRFRTIETQMVTREMRRAFEPDKKSPLGQAYRGCEQSLERLQRRINTTRRNYRQSLELLNQLQAAPAPAKPKPVQPLTVANQFVPSAEPPPLDPRPRPPFPPIPTWPFVSSPP